MHILKRNVSQKICTYFNTVNKNNNPKVTKNRNFMVLFSFVSIAFICIYIFLTAVADYNHIQVSLSLKPVSH